MSPALESILLVGSVGLAFLCRLPLTSAIYFNSTTGCPQRDEATGVAYNGHCYMASQTDSDTLDCSQARRSCNFNYGATLVYWTDRLELQFFLSKVTSFSNGSAIWIGLQRVESTWSWYGHQETLDEKELTNLVPGFADIQNAWTNGTDQCVYLLYADNQFTSVIGSSVDVASVYTGCRMRQVGVTYADAQFYLPLDYVYNDNGQLYAFNVVASGFSVTFLSGIDMHYGEYRGNSIQSAASQSSHLNTYTGTCFNEQVCADGFTLAFWFKLPQQPDSASTEYYVDTGVQELGGKGISIYHADGAIVFKVHLDPGIYNCSLQVGSDIPVNQWTHIIFSFGNMTGSWENEIMVFIDKVQSCMDSSFMEADIPNWYTYFQSCQDGIAIYDEIAFWDRVLNSDERESVYDDEDFAPSVVVFPPSSTASAITDAETEATLLVDEPLAFLPVFEDIELTIVTRPVTPAPTTDFRTTEDHSATSGVGAATAPSTALTATVGAASTGRDATEITKPTSEVPSEGGITAGPTQATGTHYLMTAGSGLSAGTESHLVSTATTSSVSAPEAPQVELAPTAIHELASTEDGSTKQMTTPGSLTTHSRPLTNEPRSSATAELASNTVGSTANGQSTTSDVAPTTRLTRTTAMELISTEVGPTVTGQASTILSSPGTAGITEPTFPLPTGQSGGSTGSVKTSTTSAATIDLPPPVFPALTGQGGGSTGSVKTSTTSAATIELTPSVFPALTGQVGGSTGSVKTSTTSAATNELTPSVFHALTRQGSGSTGSVKTSTTSAATNELTPSVFPALTGGGLTEAGQTPTPSADGSTTGSTRETTDEIVTQDPGPTAGSTGITTTASPSHLETTTGPTSKADEQSVSAVTPTVTRQAATAALSTLTANTLSTGSALITTREQMSTSIEPTVEPTAMTTEDPSGSTAASGATDITAPELTSDGVESKATEHSTWATSMPSTSTATTGSAPLPTTTDKPVENDVSTTATEQITWTTRVPSTHAATTRSRTAVTLENKPIDVGSTALEQATEPSSVPWTIGSVPLTTTEEWISNGIESTHHGGSTTMATTAEAQPVITTAPQATASTSPPPFTTRLRQFMSQLTAKTASAAPTSTTARQSTAGSRTTRRVTSDAVTPAEATGTQRILTTIVSKSTDRITISDSVTEPSTSAQATGILTATQLLLTTKSTDRITISDSVTETSASAQATGISTPTQPLLTTKSTDEPPNQAIAQLQMLVNGTLSAGQTDSQTAVQLFNSTAELADYSGAEATDSSVLAATAEVYIELTSLLLKSLSNYTLEEATEVTEASLGVVDSLFSPTNAEKWTKVGPGLVAEITRTAEHMAVNLAEKAIEATATDSIVMTNKHLVATVDFLGDSVEANGSFVFPKRDAASAKATYEIPGSVLEEHGARAVVTVLYHSLGPLLKDEGQTDEGGERGDGEDRGGGEGEEGERGEGGEEGEHEHHDSGGEGHSMPRFVVGSKVLSVSLVPPLRTTVQNAIQFGFHLSHRAVASVADETTWRSCSFLNFSIPQTRHGAWSDKGCHMTSDNGTHAQCSCDHMTSFAILLQVVDIEISEADRKALDVISMVGCGFSITGTFLMCSTYLFLRMTSVCTLIHSNLAAAIMMAQITFLFEDTIEKETVGCAVLAGLLYYFNTATFCWMLIEGVHMYSQVVVVFVHTERRRMYILIGWGLPLIFTVITVAVLRESLGTHEVCWLSLEDHSIWFFVVPVAAVILVNFYILIRVTKVIVTLTTAKSDRKLESIKKSIKASAMLLPLLGSTWVLGFLCVSEGTLVFHYLFAVCNSFQGFGLFLAYCALSTEVRDSWKKKREIWSLTRSLNARHSGKVSPSTKHEAWTGKGDSSIHSHVSPT